jgi:hypothetical protein
MTPWPVASTPIPTADVPVAQLYYQTVCRGRDDSIFVWGTEADVEGAQAYLREVNETSDVLVSLAHVLLRSVAFALREHPQFNRRLAGRRLYQFHDVNLLMPARDLAGNTQVLVIQQADRLTLPEIAETVWHQLSSCNAPDAGETCDIVRDANVVRGSGRPLVPWVQAFFNRFNLGPRWGFARLRQGSVYVNSLDFRGAPPMTSYKPSRFPSEIQLSTITQGPVRQQVIAVDGQPLVRKVAPLFIRADHRAVDAYELGGFVTTICRYFSQPWLMDATGTGLAAHAAPGPQRARTPGRRRADVAAPLPS